MPKLQTYTARPQELPTGFVPATASGVGGDIGAALHKGGQAVLQLHERIGEDESRQAIVGAAQIRTKYAALLDQANLNGEDTADLKSKMNDELSAVGENFQTTKGQDALDLHTATTNMVFDEQANRMAVTQAAAQARLQATGLLASDSATLRSNPGYLPLAEKNVDALLDTFAGKLPPDKRAEVAQEMKGELNMAAVNAAARQDPSGTKDKLNAGEWTLTPKQREQGVAEADTQLRTIRADQRYQREEADYAQKKDNATESNRLLTKVFNGTLSPTDLRYSTLPREDRENLAHFQDFWATYKENKPHPDKELSLWLDIYANSDDPRKIYNGDKIVEAAKNKQINRAEAQRLMDAVSKQTDENGRTIGTKLSQAMNEVGRAVAADLTVNWSPQNVAAIQLDYQARVLEKVADLRKAGTSPNQVFDPKSKDFVGSPEFIGMSINKIKSQMRDSGVNTALKAGETVTRDGKNWQFIGGDPKQPANWKEMGAATGGATGEF
jgi:hypothetical protein